MANKGALGVGIFFLLIGVVMFLTPYSVLNENSDWNENFRDTQFAELTIPEIHDLCSSGLGQLGQAFNEDVQKACSQTKIVAYSIYVSGIIGLILITVGAIIPSNQKLSKMNCGKCGATIDSKTKFCRKCGSSL